MERELRWWQKSGSGRSQIWMAIPYHVSSILCVCVCVCEEGPSHNDNRLDSVWVSSIEHFWLRDWNIFINNWLFGPRVLCEASLNQLCVHDLDRPSEVILCVPKPANGWWWLRLKIVCVWPNWVWLIETWKVEWIVSRTNLTHLCVYVYFCVNDRLAPTVTQLNLIYPNLMIHMCMH